jgi:hypothetical protein
MWKGNLPLKTIFPFEAKGGRSDFRGPRNWDARLPSSVRNMRTRAMLRRFSVGPEEANSAMIRRIRSQALTHPGLKGPRSPAQGGVRRWRTEPWVVWSSRRNSPEGARDR